VIQTDSRSRRYDVSGDGYDLKIFKSKISRKLSEIRVWSLLRTYQKLHMPSRMVTEDVMKSWRLKCFNLKNASSSRVLTWTRRSSNKMVSYVACLEHPHRQLIQTSWRQLWKCWRQRMLSYWEPIGKWPRTVEWWGHRWRHVTLWRHSGDITTLKMLLLWQFLSELDHLLT